MTPPPTCLGFNGDDRDLPYGGSQVSRGGVGGLGGTFESHIPGRCLTATGGRVIQTALSTSCFRRIITIEMC